MTGTPTHRILSLNIINKIVIMWVLTGCFSLAREKNASAIKVLYEGINAPCFWTSIHAFEYLIDCDRESSELFKALTALQARPIASLTQKVGILRVESLFLRGRPGLEQVLKQIKAIALEQKEEPQVRIHAFETLYKLNANIIEDNLLVEYITESENPVVGRIYASALLCQSNLLAGSRYIADFFAHSTTNSIEQMVIVFVCKSIEPIPQNLVDIVKKITDGNLYTDDLKASAIAVLLKAQAIDFNEAEKRFEQLQTDGGEYLRLAMEHAPEKSAFVIQKCSKSDDLEIRLLAAWALIKLEKGK